MGKHEDFFSQPLIMLTRSCPHQHEIVTSPPMSNMPKSNLRAPPADIANAEASPAYAALPIPSSSAQLRDPNQRFLDSEAFTDRFASHLSTHMEKINRRAMKRWTEAGADHAELGMVLNGFSLSETGNLAHALEKIGQAADATFVATGHMVSLEDMPSTSTS
jgi:sorting nexin-41/42